MQHPATGEQAAVVDGFRVGHDLVVEAGAGTGKTSTLLRLANDNRHLSGLYLAYNAVTAKEARQRFPRSVECRTAHALAMRAVGHRYRERLEMPRQPGREVAEILRIDSPHRISRGTVLAPWQVASIALDTVSGFCTSADPEIAPRHVPPMRGLDDPASHATLTAVVLPYARRAWADIQGKAGRLRAVHDHYLKDWHLAFLAGRLPPFEVDYLMYDEAQDADAAVADVVRGQGHVQKVVVGDRNQALYQWRGAVDAMDTFEGVSLTLSKSFRFGEAIADEANVFLGMLGAPLRLTGNEPIASSVGPLSGPPRAVLCRSNAQALAEVMQAADEGRKAALARGADDIRRMAESALSLKEGRGAAHRDLMAFDSWGAVQAYVEDEGGGGDLKVFVRLVDQYGAEVLIDVIGALPDPDRADVVVSTAHNAKGLEFETVRIAPGFNEPTEEHPALPPEELMLMYVAVTRAIRELDDTVFAWAHGAPPRRARRQDDWLDGLGMAG